MFKIRKKYHYSIYGYLKSEGEYDSIYKYLKFEGEYLNGKVIKGKGYSFRLPTKEIFILNDGKGKEYYYCGRLQFEGDYFNGLRWNGKGYNIEGKEEFEIKDGKGKGKVFDEDGDFSIIEFG